jgi:hypothetical protein
MLQANLKEVVGWLSMPTAGAFFKHQRPLQNQKTINENFLSGDHLKMIRLKVFCSFWC